MEDSFTNLIPSIFSMFPYEVPPLSIRMGAESPPAKGVPALQAEVGLLGRTRTRGGVNKKKR